MFKRLAGIPLIFFGVGIYRAWLAIFFRYDAFPTVGFADYAIFEAAIGIASFAVAFLAPRIAPLWCNRRIIILTALSLVGGSTLIVLGCFVFACTPLKHAGFIMAGIGLGFLIIMWTEFYACLNPLRVALYHAAAIFLGEAIKWLFTGLTVPFLIFFALTLPLVSLSWVHRSLGRIPEVSRPRPATRADMRAFPWKPIALMTICTFATGFGVFPDQPILAGNVVGAMLMCAIVFFGVLSSSRWFNFDTIYRLAFPLLTLGFLFIAPSFSLNPQVGAACYDAGYTMLSMFIMIVLSNISYRTGISAAWLNGIERGFRYLSEALGWGLYAYSAAHLGQSGVQSVHLLVTVAVVIAFSIIFLTEKRLSARWGINLDVKDDAALGEPGRIAMRVSDLSREFDLSPREEEVLQLMAQRKTIGEIEEDLFVAQGTVKAHMHHIYTKLGVAGKDELMELLAR